MPPLKPVPICPLRPIENPAASHLFFRNAFFQLFGVLLNPMKTLKSYRNRATSRSFQFAFDPAILAGLLAIYGFSKS